MSEIVKSKIEEIAPSKILENSMMMEVESWVSSIFNQIDYKPKNLKKSIDKAWHNASPSDTISDFVYRVWRYDS